MEDKITRNQFIAILINAFIGLGVIALSTETCAISKQSAWIAVLVGGSFPLIILCSCAYIQSKVKNYEIYALLKYLYGNYLSKAILIFFIFLSIFYQGTVVMGYVGVAYLSFNYMVPELIILFTVIFISLYTTSKGLSTLGRLSEICLVLILFSLSLVTIKLSQGSYRNIFPIFEHKTEILYTIPITFFAYQGGEISFFIIDKVIDKKNMFSASMIAEVIVTFLYTYTVFVVIFYLGWNFASKIKYSLLFVFESLKPPLFSDLKKLFLLIWSFTIILTLSIGQYYLCYIINKLTKIPLKKICIFIFPIISTVSLITAKIDNTNIILAISYIFNALLIIFAISTVILVFLKTRGKKS